MSSPLELRSREIVQQAVLNYSDLTMTTGLNLSGTVLLDLATDEGFCGELLFVDTGFHFPQTLSLWGQLKDRYPMVNFITLTERGNESDPEALYLTDPAECCSINKIQPLNRYLEQKRPRALLNARTQGSASTRSNLAPIEPGDPIRFNPLFAWGQYDLEDYAERHRLDVHPLYQEGYLSLGCWPCTRAVRPGEDARAGRFNSQGRTECGIWSQSTSGERTSRAIPLVNHHSLQQGLQ
jgi:phosphoadenosine phosphosulfate reductase